MTCRHIRLDLHPIDDPGYRNRCRSVLKDNEALVLKDFLIKNSVHQVVEASEGRQAEAFYANSTHNVYLTPPDPSLPVLWGGTPAMLPSVLRTCTPMELLTVT